MNESDPNRAMVEELSDPEHLAESFAKLDSLHPDQAWERVKTFAAGAQAQKKSRPFNPYRLLRTWTGYAAAALVLVATGTYLWTQYHKPKQEARVELPVFADVPAPSSNRSVITLSNGQHIYIDSAQTGWLATQGTARIRKNADGSIEYADNGRSGHTQFNSLTVPRGSQIASMILSDGSKIFVNAGSTIRYPVSFPARERSVQVTGEAYIEVARDARRKFVATGGGMTTEVLGTHFDINTYPDESEMRVTLLEGSVKVISGADQKLIRPGEQASYTAGAMQVVSDVDLDQVVAWKNGLFDFQDKHLPEVMRQLSRWYDLHVSYQGKIPNIEFFGQMGRNLKLSDVLNVLRDAGLRFRMEQDRHLIVL